MQDLKPNSAAWDNVGERWSGISALLTETAAGFDQLINFLAVDEHFTGKTANILIGRMRRSARSIRPMADAAEINAKTVAKLATHIEAWYTAMQSVEERYSAARKNSIMTSWLADQLRDVPFGSWPADLIDSPEQRARASGLGIMNELNHLHGRWARVLVARTQNQVGWDGPEADPDTTPAINMPRREPNR